MTAPRRDGTTLPDRHDKGAPLSEVWVWMRSNSGGPDYDVAGVFATRESALAAAGGAIHPGAGTLESAGGIGWHLPDGSRAWEEDEDGELRTEDAAIWRYEVQP